MDESSIWRERYYALFRKLEQVAGFSDSEIDEMISLFIEVKQLNSNKLTDFSLGGK